MALNTIDLISEYVEKIWNKGETSALEELTTLDFTFQMGSESERNRTVMTQFVKTLHSAFPDWNVRIVETIIDNNMVAARWKGHATHKGSFYGIEPTEKQIITSGINIYEIDAGKIKKEWEQMDTLGLLRQLGVLP